MSVTSTLAWYLKARLEHTRVEACTGLSSSGRLLAVPTNIRLGQNWLPVANTLAYYDASKIMVVKSFIVQAHGSKCGRKTRSQNARVNINWIWFFTSECQPNLFSPPLAAGSKRRLDSNPWSHGQKLAAVSLCQCFVSTILYSLFCQKVAGE